MEFRSYQQEIFDRLKEGVNTCVQQDTGTGKSLIQIKKALECVRMGQQVVIIVPRIELINNLVDYVKKLDPNVYSYHYCPVNNKLGRFQPNKRLYIGTYQSYQKVADRLDPDVVIHDECFLQGTLVDGKPVESYKVGDFIFSWCEQTGCVTKQRINHVFKNPVIAENMMTIKFSNGKEFTCTKNHPIWSVNHGTFQKAERFQQQQREEVYCLRNDQTDIREQSYLRNLWGSILYYFKMYSERHLSKRKQTFLYPRMSHGMETRKLFELYRGSTFNIVGVESVTFHTQEDRERFTGCYTYNFEVNDFNTYFAEGILVHNCHHLRAKTWESLIDQWSDAWHIGFTATPVRYDGKSLKKYLPNLILGRSTEWYIDNGYLSDFDCYTDPDAVKFVSPKGLDELDKQQSLFDQNDLIGDAVKTWLKRAYGRKTIVFATGEDHAYHLEEQFNLRNGECARVITGKISQTLRDQYLYEFENSSKHPVLINIGILTEGVDTRNAEIVQLCRYTHSLSLYKQMVGRCLRPKKNGSKALILDHAGNISTHFEPDFPIDWEELYNRDENAVENFDRSSLMYCCGCCDRPLISLVELKGQQSIICPHCGYANIVKSLTSKQRRQLDIDESIELVEYKVPRHIQILMKIQNDRKLKHNEKIMQILKVSAPRKDLLQTLINIGVSENVADKFYLKNVS